jgi:hypothetical protein
MRHPVAASILDSGRKALIESTFVYISGEDSRVPKITHILLQIAAHSSKAVFK